jgi:hypothetical protein
MTFLLRMYQWLLKLQGGVNLKKKLCKIKLVLTIPQAKALLAYAI